MFRKILKLLLCLHQAMPVSVGCRLYYFTFISYRVKKHMYVPFRLNILMKVKRGNSQRKRNSFFSPKVNILIPSLTPVPPQAEGHYHRTIRVQGSEIKFTKFMLPFYVTS